MNFLFIVQGEGRGHLTQAIALEDMLTRNGHSVVKILVGKSSTRTLPDFFTRKVKAPVEQFCSPNFLPSAQNKRVHLLRSVAYNALHFFSFVRSMFYLRKQIKTAKVDMVINFYDLMAGLTYFFLRPSTPYVCVGHQYLYLHDGFKIPRRRRFKIKMLQFFTRMTSLCAKRRIALSFYRLWTDNKHRIVTVPPLLRQEVLDIQPKKGNYIMGYMVNNGFMEEVKTYHAAYPDTPLHFFWDKKMSEPTLSVDATMTLHELDDKKFLEMLAGCKAYATTAGFESICEAFYLGKPVMMVPAHIEQDCNAYDAVRAGAGYLAQSFDLKPLERYTKTFCPNDDFVCWASSAELRIIYQLEEAFGEILSKRKVSHLSLIPASRRR